MFEQITIHRGMEGQKFDLGQLAETLLFYQSNLILLDRSSLIGIIDAVGKDNLLRLVDEFGVKLSYHREIFATMTNNQNGVKLSKFTDIKFGGKPEKKIHSVHEEIEDLISWKLGSSRSTRKFSAEVIR